jgi:hypothetical protein
MNAKAEGGICIYIETQGSSGGNYIERSCTVELEEVAGCLVWRYTTAMGIRQVS